MDTESDKIIGADPAFRGTALRDPAFRDPALRDPALRQESDNWKMLYILTEHWQSDLRFFEDELRFLRDLIDKYFFRLIDEANMEKTRKHVTRLAKLETQRAILSRSVTRHLQHLANFLENPFPYNTQSYRDEHAKLEIGVVEYLKNFRQMKRDIFGLLNTVMESEKTNPLLKG